MSWRRIAHLDMDAFYASVELLRRPELRGCPVAIGGHGEPSRRGVVTTATYEARASGIRSGMALRRAAELCPECVFLPVDFAEYRRYSRRFKAAIATLTDRIEDRGIDEVYIDLSAVPGIRVERGVPVARDLQRRVHEATGLGCSIGLAPNKLLAKIASELHKPGGITAIDEYDIAAVIWPLPVRRINGIGPKADLRLEELGIRTIGALAAAPPAMLIAHFGRSFGQWMHEAAHGRDQRPIVTASEPVSMSRETTFEHDLHLRRDWQALAACLAELCRELAGDLHRRGYAGRTIGVKARYDDFRIVTRDHTLALATDDAATMRRVAFECLSRVPAARRLRLLGVRVGGLSRGAPPRQADAAGVVAAPSLAAAWQGELPFSGPENP
ncbi:MAG: DNA polymerase IV [Burkholderiaceae bacterium]|nr:DNA polymerase IV [Burkholderiaceae bacterium]